MKKRYQYLFATLLTIAAMKNSFVQLNKKLVLLLLMLATGLVAHATVQTGIMMQGLTRTVNNVTMCSFAIQSEWGGDQIPSQTGSSYTFSNANMIHGTVDVTLNGTLNFQVGTAFADVITSGSFTVTIESSSLWFYGATVQTKSGSNVSGCSASVSSDKHTLTVTIPTNKTFGAIIVNHVSNPPMTNSNTTVTVPAGDYWVSNSSHRPMPEPTVAYGQTTLVKDTDYTLSWSNNSSAGTGTVTVTGKGNYAGSATGTFSIRWARYYVHFDKNHNDATGTMSDQQFTYNAAQNLTANTFSRTGCSFDGWCNSSNGEVTYTDGQSVSNLTAEDGETITLYAKWTLITYNITYDLNGGSVATANPTSYNVTTPTFTLNNPIKTGYKFDGWTGTDLNEATQTVTITQGSIGDRNYTAHWTDVWGVTNGANGSSDQPYLITNTAGLDLLATEVNNGSDFSGKFFRLGNNIAYTSTTAWDNTDGNIEANNFAAIGRVVGNTYYSFKGTFDGDGHTVSGIRITQKTSENQGLFGHVGEGGTVENLTLSNARIFSNKTSVGGIAGDSSGTITNCHVTADVNILGNNNYHGGIAGNSNGDITGCTSAAVLNGSGSYRGGITGQTAYGTVSNCIVTGVSYSCDNQNYLGAIVGKHMSGTLSNNYYHACSVNGATTNIGVGTTTVGVSNDTDGAKSVHALTLADGITAIGNETVVINGTTYYAAGSTITLTYNGTPAAGMAFDDFTVTDANGNPVTVTGDTFTMPASDVTVTVIFAPIPPSYTVHFVAVGHNEGSQTAYEGDEITLPGSVSVNVNGWTFSGWVDAELAETVQKPVFYAPGASYTVTANATLYALYTRTEGGTGELVYELITEAPSDWSGNYVITNGETSSMYVLKGVTGSSSGTNAENSNNCSAFESSGITLTDNVLDNVADDYVFTLAAEGSYYTIQSVSIGSYYGMSSTSYLYAYSGYNNTYCNWTPGMNDSHGVSLRNAANGSYPYFSFSINSSYFWSGSANNANVLRLWKENNGDGVYYTTTPFTVIAVSNNDAWGTISVNGYTITATPATGYRLFGCEVTSGTATVAINGNTITVTPESNCTVTVIFELSPTYTVTYISRGASAGSVTTYIDDVINLPASVGNTPDGWTFSGWVETRFVETTEVPAYYAPGEEYTVTGNATLYAMFTRVEGSGEDMVYQLTDDLAVGGRYVITSGTYAVGNAIVANNHYVNAQPVTIDSSTETLTVPSGVNINTVLYEVESGNSDDGWVFKNVANNKYLGLDAYEYLAMSETPLAWLYDYSDSSGYHYLDNQVDTDGYYYLSYDSSNNRFTTNKSPKEINLYQEIHSTVTFYTTDPTVDGYYLIGPDWTYGAIEPGSVFTENPNAQGEYMLRTVLSEGDEIKVVRVENNAIAGLYPDGLDNQYHVDAAHAGDVTIYFSTEYNSGWSEFGGYFYIEVLTNQYNVNIDEAIAYGSVEADKETAEEGDTVTLTVTPDEGYLLQDLYVVDANDNLLDVDEGENNTYTFTMPASDVTVSADFITQWTWLQLQLEEDGNVIILDRDIVCVDRDEAPLTVPTDICVTLDLNGHTINRNLSEATENGYVILVGGMLTVNDSSASGTGAITGGNNTEYGGVYVYSNSTFTMTGGSITGNSGGVFVAGTFQISGSPVITGNTVNGSANNVYLNNGAIITVTGALTENALIGVRMYTPGVFTSGLSGNGTAANFTSDDPDLAIGLNADGEAVLDVITTITQTIALSAGVNWVSVCVDITLADLENAIVAALPGSAGMKISSQGSGFTQYNGSTWRGGLRVLNLAQMYRIEVPSACEITLTGLPIDSSELPITISNGNNWIAFPLSTSMSVNAAFAGFPATGDKISSQGNGFTQYNGSTWRGGLRNLEPGKGYIYNSTATGTKTLIFSTSGAKQDAK